MLKFNKIFFIIFIVGIIFFTSTVYASDLNETEVCSFEEDYSNLEVNDNFDESNLKMDNISDNLYSESGNIYVNNDTGDDANDGRSQDSSLKSIDKALNVSKNNDTIHLAGGKYSGLKNTAINIDKSINFIGSNNTIIDGLNTNFIFNITDGISVTFKNIKFVNAFKQTSPFNPVNMYGAALEIHNATVLIDNCDFVGNYIAYENIGNKYNYGGAISNFGDLTIINSYFSNNRVASTSGLFGHGGTIYNKGKLLINSSTFNNSTASVFSYGGVIYNEGDLVIDKSLFTNAFSFQESKGSVIYNNGNCTLLNSIIENNTISRANFYYINGAIYNYGNLMGYGNIFRNNSGVYEAPNPEYRGSPNIFNTGNLNLTYNVFVDNAPFNGIAPDIYLNGGKVISLDDNWWSTNENPYSKNKINVDLQVNSWFVLNLIPEYTPLNYGEAVNINASWILSSGLTPKSKLPYLNLTFTSLVNDKLINITRLMSENGVSFNFNDSYVKGLYEVTASMGEFDTSVLVDVGKVISYIMIDVPHNITYTEDLILNLKVTAEDGNVPTGVVSVFANNNVYSVNLTNGIGILNLSDLNPDKYNFKIVYEGNENYFKAYNYTNVTINKAKSDLSVIFPDIKVDQKGIVSITLGPKGVQGQAYLYINGVRKKILYLYNGQTNVSVSNFAEGEYNVSVEFWGTKYYEAATANTTFKVTRYDTSIGLNVGDIKVGENQTIQITVTPSDLRGQAILNINGVNSTIFLEAEVTNVTIANLGAGTYDIKVYYPENSKYYSSEASSSFRVLKTFTELSVTITEGDDLNGKIVVKTNYTNCTGPIGVYINYKLCTVNLTNGVATFNVKFDKGTNYIYIFYDGDENYEEVTWNTTLGVAEEFILIGQNVTSYQYNDFNYTVRLIEYNGIPMPNRVVNVLFNGNKYNITTNNEGIAHLLLHLNTGNYRIYATYKNQTVANTLKINEIKFTLKTGDIVYGSDETITVEFDKNVTGKVNLFIDGILNHAVNIVDSKAVYNISGLNAGEYDIIVKYTNDYFNSSEITNHFQVKKADPSIKVNVNDIVFGENGTVKAILPDDASGSIEFIVDGASHVVDLADGMAQFDLIDMQKGLHNITVRYSGNSNYNNVTSKATFSVKDSHSDIILTVNNACYGENITISAVLNDNATGNLIFAVGSLSKTVEIKDGVASWTFSGVNVGSHLINATYMGDTYYVSSFNSTSFEVSKANSTMELVVGDVYLNENILIYTIMSPNATGRVLFSISDYYSPRYKTISDSVAVWYISPLNTGTYTVIASYEGDNNYYASNASYIINVTQRKSVLEVNIADASKNDRVTANVRLTTSTGEAINGTVNLTVGDRNYRVPINNGVGTLIIGKIAPGNYTYHANYAGNDEYSKSSISGSFKVVEGLLNLKITASNVTTYYGANKEFSVTVVDDNNKAVPNLDIIVKINGVSYTRITDDNGKVSIPVNLAIGKYSAVVTFIENSRYYGVTLNRVIEVLTTLQGNDVVALYGSNAQYVTIFTDTNGKALSAVDVTFKVSGKSYTIKTFPNGVSKVNLNFSPGRYVISVTNPASGQSISNRIFIFKKIMENKNLVKYFGSTKVYKVRAYDNKGKAVGKGKIVTFKVNGKTYKVKTDKKGYAKCKINLKPKTYKITATFNGFKVSNKIVIKPVLTVKSITKKGKYLVFKAKLVNIKAKPVKNKKITFKFKGKTYKAKTNKKGIATVKVKPKLKYRKYTLKVKYGKSTATRSLKIVK